MCKYPYISIHTYTCTHHTHAYSVSMCMSYTSYNSNINKQNWGRGSGGAGKGGWRVDPQWESLGHFLYDTFLSTGRSHSHKELPSAYWMPGNCPLTYIAFLESLFNSSSLTLKQRPWFQSPHKTSQHAELSCSVQSRLIWGGPGWTITSTSIY